VCAQLTRGDWLVRSNQLLWGDLSTPESCEERWKSLVTALLFLVTVLWSGAVWSSFVLWSYYRDRARHGRKGGIELMLASRDHHNNHHHHSARNHHDSDAALSSSSSPGAPHSHHLSNTRHRSASLSSKSSMTAGAVATSGGRRSHRVVLLPLDIPDKMGVSTTPPSAPPALEFTPATPTSPTQPTPAPPRQSSPPPNSHQHSRPHHHHRDHRHDKQGGGGGGSGGGGTGTKRRLTYPASRESQSGVIVYAPVMISEEEARRMGAREGVWRSCPSPSPLPSPSASSSSSSTSSTSTVTATYPSTEKLVPTESPTEMTAPYDRGV
jgi:hypothetical protein